MLMMESHAFYNEKRIFSVWAVKISHYGAIPSLYLP